MKMLMFLILLILAALGALWWLNGQSTQSNSPARGQKTQPQAGQQVARRQAPAMSGAKRKKAPDKNAFDYFIDYNTGAMPLRIQRHSHSKLNKIRDKENKQLEDAMK